MMVQMDLTKTRPRPAFTPLGSMLVALLTLVLVMSLVQLVERESVHQMTPQSPPTTVDVTAPPQP